MTLNDYFNDQPQHPTVAHWEALRERATDSKLTFRRLTDEFSRGGAEFVADFHFSDSNPTQEVRAWEFSLDRGLLDVGFRAADVENEGARLGYGLAARMEPIEVRFGDGFFNSVLVHTLEPSLRSWPDGAGLLKEIRQPRPYDAGPALGDCQQRIKDVIRELAADITALGYPHDEATDILGRALLCYLDDRFSVSRRRGLGW